jgi:chromate transporter
MEPSPEPPVTTPRPSLHALFWMFLRIGLTAFGGSTQAWTYREVVERRRWLDERAFLAGFTIAQVLPGSNPLNVALYVGMTLRGGLGATAAACGMVFPAFCVIMAMGYLYRAFGNLSTTHAVLDGIAAVGIGATLSLGCKVAVRLPRKLLPVLVAAATFMAVGVLHWPLVPVVLAVVPISIALAFRSRETHADVR